MGTISSYLWLITIIAPLYHGSHIKDNVGLDLSHSHRVSSSPKSHSSPPSKNGRWEALMGVTEKEYKALIKDEGKYKDENSHLSKYQALKMHGGSKYEKMLQEKRIKQREKRHRRISSQTEKERMDDKLFANQQSRKMREKLKEKTGFTCRRSQRLHHLRQLVREGKHTPEHLEELEKVKRKRKIKYQREKAKKAAEKNGMKDTAPPAKA